MADKTIESKDINQNNPYIKVAVSSKEVTIYEDKVKPMLDRIMSFCGLAVLLPVFGAVSLLIVFDDPGPGNLFDPMAKYNNIRLGMNSRLDTLQAAILLAKFSHFISFELDQVNRVAEQYTQRLRSVEQLILPMIQPGYFSSWAKYTIELPGTVNRDKIQRMLKSIGIPTMVYYKKPMHKQKAFHGTVSEWSVCPVTETLCERVLCLPIHPYLLEDEIEIVCKELIKEIK